MADMQPRTICRNELKSGQGVLLFIKIGLPARQPKLFFA